ncbi:MAG: PAS domain S-box protein, partial [Candidatus Omnitrophica bacterium]|nr:PAS domain S-box protein [Candidatus Omnitrophota bacterium]
WQANVQLQPILKQRRREAISFGRVNEIIDLAIAFEDMFQDLQTVTVSRDEFAREISERKQAQEALSASNARIDELAQHSGIVVWEVNAQGLYIYISDFSQSILGYSPDELVLKKYFWDLYPENDRETLKQLMLTNFDNKKPFKNFTNPLMT